MHRLLLHNGEIRDTSEKLISPGQVGFLNGWGVFSTLRIKDGVLFEWDRHYARMKKDAALMHIPFPAEAAPMHGGLLRLVEANQAWNAALRVAVVRNRGGMFEGPAITRDYEMIAFTSDLKKWGSGVRLGIKPRARHSAMEFAGAKILSWSMNLTWLEDAQRQGFDETLLLDDRGRVSECTSANVFVVRGGHVTTPGLDSGCLPGITRAVVLEEIRVPGISIAEGDVYPAGLTQADEVFITSSTRDLLPVLEVNGQQLSTRWETGARLAEAFRSYMERYVAEARPRVSPEVVRG